MLPSPHRRPVTRLVSRTLHKTMLRSAHLVVIASMVFSFASPLPGVSTGSAHAAPSASANPGSPWLPMVGIQPAKLHASTSAPSPTPGIILPPDDVAPTPEPALPLGDVSPTPEPVLPPGDVSPTPEPVLPPGDLAPTPEPVLPPGDASPTPEPILPPGDVSPVSAQGLLTTTTTVVDDFENGQLEWHVVTRTLAALLTPTLESPAQWGAYQLRVDYDLPAGQWGRLARRFAIPQDWQSYHVLSLQFHGAASGALVQLEVITNTQAITNGARLVYEFRDDRSGWRTLNAPWSQFHLVEGGQVLSGTGEGVDLSHVVGLGLRLAHEQPASRLYLPLISKNAGSEQAISQLYVPLISKSGSSAMAMNYAAQATQSVSASVTGTFSLDEVTLRSEDLALVSLRVTGDHVSEAGPDVGEFQVSRSEMISQALTVSYAVGGTAVNGTDYVTLTGQVTLPAGVVTASVVITPLDDVLLEEDEQLSLTLLEGPGYLLGSAVSAALTIVDDEALNALLVSVTASDAQAREAPIPPDAGEFVIFRTKNLTEALTVNWSLGGTAQNGVDYTALDSSAVLGVGVAAITLTVSPLDDLLAEGAETVVLSLTSGSAYSLGVSSVATVTLYDDDATLQIMATDPLASEADQDPAHFTITRTGSLDDQVVAYAIGGTAQNGLDYAFISSTLALSAGVAVATVTIAPIDDSLGEGPETVELTLATDPAYVILGDPQARAVITDDERFVEVVAVQPDVEENGAPVEAVLVRRVNLETSAPLDVPFDLGGTASLGVDYALSGTLGNDTVVIPAGASAVTVTVNPLDDDLTEGHETITLALRASPAYTLGQNSSVTLRIVDDEQMVMIVADAPYVSELNSLVHEPAATHFEVTRTGSTAEPLTVSYTISGTAVNGVDYEAIATWPISRVVSYTLFTTSTAVVTQVVWLDDPTQAVTGTLLIPAGDASVRIVISPKNDALAEGDESVRLALVGDSSYVVGTPGSAQVTIADDDAGIQVSLSATPLSGTIELPPLLSDDIPATVNTSLTVTFYATATTPEEGPLSYWLDFGDGSRTTLSGYSADPITVTHVYTVGGRLAPSLRVMNEMGGEALAELELDINRAPLAHSTYLRLRDSTVITHDLGILTSDADGDALTCTLVALPLFGSARIEDGVLLYTRSQDSFGTDRVQYQVVDGRGGASLGTIAIVEDRVRAWVTPSGVMVTGTNQVYTLTVGYYNQQGELVDMPPQAAGIEWISSDPAIIAVTPVPGNPNQARVQAVGPWGTAYILARNPDDHMLASQLVAVSHAEPESDVILVSDDQVIFPPIRTSSLVADNPWSVFAFNDALDDLDVGGFGAMEVTAGYRTVTRTAILTATGGGYTQVVQTFNQRPLVLQDISLSVGDLVLAEGSADVVGRVVSVQPRGQASLVVVEDANLGELYRNMSFSLDTVAMAEAGLYTPDFLDLAEMVSFGPLSVQDTGSRAAARAPSASEAVSGKDKIWGDPDLLDQSPFDPKLGCGAAFQMDGVGWDPVPTLKLNDVTIVKVGAHQTVTDIIPALIRVLGTIIQIKSEVKVDEHDHIDAEFSVGARLEAVLEAGYTLKIKGRFIASCTYPLDASAPLRIHIDRWIAQKIPHPAVVAIVLGVGPKLDFILHLQIEAEISGGPSMQARLYAMAAFKLPQIGWKYTNYEHDGQEPGLNFIPDHWPSLSDLFEYSLVSADGKKATGITVDVDPTSLLTWRIDGKIGAYMIVRLTMAGASVQAGGWGLVQALKLISITYALLGKDDKVEEIAAAIKVLEDMQQKGIMIFGARAGLELLVDWATDYYTLKQNAIYGKEYAPDTKARGVLQFKIYSDQWKQILGALPSLAAKYVAKFIPTIELPEWSKEWKIHYGMTPDKNPPAAQNPYIGDDDDVVFDVQLDPQAKAVSGTVYYLTKEALAMRPEPGEYSPDISMFFLDESVVRVAKLTVSGDHLTGKWNPSSAEATRLFDIILRKEGGYDPGKDRCEQLEKGGFLDGRKELTFYVMGENKWWNKIPLIPPVLPTAYYLGKVRVSCSRMSADVGYTADQPYRGGSSGKARQPYEFARYVFELLNQTKDEKVFKYPGKLIPRADMGVRYAGESWSGFDLPEVTVCKNEADKIPQETLMWAINSGNLLYSMEATYPPGDEIKFEDVDEEMPGKQIDSGMAITLSGIPGDYLREFMQVAVKTQTIGVYREANTLLLEPDRRLRYLTWPKDNHAPIQHPFTGQRLKISSDANPRFKTDKTSGVVAITLEPPQPAVTTTYGVIRMKDGTFKLLTLTEIISDSTGYIKIDPKEANAMGPDIDTYFFIRPLADGSFANAGTETPMELSYLDRLSRASIKPIDELSFKVPMIAHGAGQPYFGTVTVTKPSGPALVVMPDQRLIWLRNECMTKTVNGKVVPDLKNCVNEIEPFFKRLGLTAETPGPIGTEYPDWLGGYVNRAGGDSSTIQDGAGHYLETCGQSHTCHASERTVWNEGAGAREFHVVAKSYASNEERVESPTAPSLAMEVKKGFTIKEADCTTREEVQTKVDGGYCGASTYERYRTVEYSKEIALSNGQKIKVPYKPDEKEIPWSDWHLVAHYPTGNPGCGLAWARNDPHVSTLDGQRFDSFSLGDFIYYQPRPGHEEGGITIHGRQERISGWEQGNVVVIVADWTAWITALAIKAGDTTFEFGVGSLNTPRIDGEFVSLEPGIHQYGEVDLKVNSSTSVEIIYKDKSVDIVEENGAYLSFLARMPWDDSHYGMFGRPNGIYEDDMQWPDGTPAIDAYDLADGWRITQTEKSLFTYAPDTGPETYNIRQDDEPPSRAELLPYMEQARQVLLRNCRAGENGLDEVDVRDAALELYAGRSPENLASLGVCWWDVYGQVTNELVPGLAVPGARVSVWRGSASEPACQTWTDRYGIYHCQVPSDGQLSGDAGQLRVEISNRGQAEFSVPLAQLPPVWGIEPLRQDMQVAPTTLQLAGTVKNRSGVPLYNTELYVEGPDNAGLAKTYAKADAHGVYTAYMMLDNGVLSGANTYHLSYNPEFDTDPDAERIVNTLERPFSNLVERALNVITHDLVMTGLKLRFSGRVSYLADDSIPLQGMRVIVTPQAPHPDFTDCDCTTLVYRDPQSISDANPFDPEKETTNWAEVGTYKCDVQIEDVTPFDAEIKIVGRDLQTAITHRVVTVDPSGGGVGELYNQVTNLRVKTPVLYLEGLVSGPSGQPVAGADVSVSSPEGLASLSDRTGVDGRYGMYLPLDYGIVQGRVNYDARYLNVGTAGQAFFFGSDPDRVVTVTQDLVLHGSAMTFYGRVMDTRTEQPMYDAQVSISSPQDPSWSCATETGANPDRPDAYVIPNKQYPRQSTECRIVTQLSSPDEIELVYDIQTPDDHRLVTRTVPTARLGEWRAVAAEFTATSKLPPPPTVVSMTGAITTLAGLPLHGGRLTFDVVDEETGETLLPWSKEGPLGQNPEPIYPTARTDASGYYTASTELNPVKVKGRELITASLVYTVGFRSMGFVERQTFTLLVSHTTIVTRDMLYTGRTVFFRGLITNTHAVDMPLTQVVISSPHLSMVGGSACRTQTDADGTYLCVADTLSTEPISIAYSVTGLWGQQRFTDTVTVDSSQDMVEHMLPDHTVDLTVLRLVGYVQTPSGVPLEGVEITASSDKDYRRGHGLTDADGFYDLDLVLQQTEPGATRVPGILSYWVGYGEAVKTQQVDFEAVVDQSTEIRQDFELNLRVVTFKGRVQNVFVDRITVNLAFLSAEIKRAQLINRAAQALCASTGNCGMILSYEALVDLDHANTMADALAGRRWFSDEGLNAWFLGRLLEAVTGSQPFFDGAQWQGFDAQLAYAHTLTDQNARAMALLGIAEELVALIESQLDEARPFIEPGGADNRVYGTHVLITSPQVGKLCDYALQGSFFNNEYECSARIFTDQPFEVVYNLKGEWGSAVIESAPFDDPDVSLPPVGGRLNVTRTLEVSPTTLLLFGQATDRDGLPLREAQLSIRSPHFLNTLGDLDEISQSTDGNGAYRAYVIVDKTVSGTLGLDYRSTFAALGQEFVLSQMASIDVAPNSLVMNSSLFAFPHRRIRLSGELKNLTDPSLPIDGKLQIVAANLGEALCEDVPVSSDSGYSCDALVLTDTALLLNYRVVGYWGTINLVNQYNVMSPLITRTLQAVPRVLVATGRVVNPSGKTLSGASVSVSSFNIVPNSEVGLASTTSETGHYMVKAVLGDGVTNVGLKYAASVQGNQTTSARVFDLGREALVSIVTHDLEISTSQLRLHGSLINSLVPGEGKWPGGTEFYVTSPTAGMLCQGKAAAEYDCTATLETTEPFDVVYHLNGDWGSEIIAGRVLTLPELGSQGSWTQDLTVTPTMLRIQGRAVVSRTDWSAWQPVANQGVSTMLLGVAASPLVASEWGQSQTDADGRFDKLVMLRHGDDVMTGTVSLAFGNNRDQVEHVPFTATAKIVNELLVTPDIHFVLPRPPEPVVNPPSTARTINFRVKLSNAMAPGIAGAQPAGYFKFDAPLFGVLCAYTEGDGLPMTEYSCNVVVHDERTFDVVLYTWGPYGNMERQIEVVDIPAVGEVKYVYEEIMLEPTTIHLAGMVASYTSGPSPIPVSGVEMTILASTAQSGLQLIKAQTTSDVEGRYDLFLIIPPWAEEPDGPLVMEKGQIKLTYELNKDKGIRTKFIFSGYQLERQKLNTFNNDLPFEWRRVRFMGRVINQNVPSLSAPGIVYVTRADDFVSLCTASIDVAAGTYSCDAQLQSSDPLTISYRLIADWGTVTSERLVSDVGGVGQTTLVEHDLVANPTMLRVYGKVSDVYGKALEGARLTISGRDFSGAAPGVNTDRLATTDANGFYQVYVFLVNNSSHQGQLVYTIQYYATTETFERGYAGLLYNRLNDQQQNLELAKRAVTFDGRVRNIYAAAMGLTGRIVITSPTEGFLCSAVLDDGSSHINNPLESVGEYECTAWGVTAEPFDIEYHILGDLADASFTEHVEFSPVGSNPTLVRNFALPATTLWLEGQVQGDVGQPLGGASLNVAGNNLQIVEEFGSGSSGQYGVYLFFAKDATQATLRLDARYGLFSHSQAVTAPLSSQALVTHVVGSPFVFDERRLELYGRVVNEHTAQALSGASVRMNAPGLGEWCDTTTSSNGSYYCTTDLSGDVREGFAFTTTVSGLSWGSDTRQHVVPAGSLPLLGLSASVLLDLGVQPTVLRVMGTVQDPAGHGLSGAIVSVSGDAAGQASSDPSGRYVVDLLLGEGATAANLNVSTQYGVASLSQALASIPVTPRALRVYTHTVTLAARQVNLAGQVVNTHLSGVGLTGAQVRLTTPGHANWCQLAADANGQYACPPILVDGGFVVTATASGPWGSVQASRAITPAELPAVGQQGTIDLDLPYAPTTLHLFGQVSQPGGQGLTGAALAVQTGVSGVEASAASDAQGRYDAYLAFPGMSATTTLTTRVTYGPAALVESYLSSGELLAGNLTSQRADLVFSSRKMTLQGRVLNANLAGATIGGARVSLYSAGEGLWCDTTANGDGAYQCAPVVLKGDLSSGYSFTGVLSSDLGGAQISRTLGSGDLPAIGAHGTLAQDLSLSPTTLHITGTVVDAAGQGLGGVTVQATGGQAPVVATTDAQGVYRLTVTFGQGVTTADLELRITYFALAITHPVHVALNVGQLTELGLDPFEFSARKMTLRGRVVNSHVPAMRLGNVQLSLTGPGAIGPWCDTTADGVGSYACSALMLGGDLSGGFVFTAVLTGTWGTRQRVYTIPLSSLPYIGQDKLLDYDLGVNLTTLRLSGRLVDPAGRGLAGAAISAAVPDMPSDSATTNSEGAYDLDLAFFDGVTSANLELLASCSQGLLTQTYSLSFPVTSRQLTTRSGQDLTFSSRRVRVSGRVANANLPGHAIGDAALRLETAGLGVWCETSSAANGDYQCQPLRLTGDYADLVLTGTVSGIWGVHTQVYTVLSATLPPAGEDEAVSLDLEAEPTTLRLQGRVVDADEQGLSGATVRVRSGSTPAAAVTNAQGEYTLTLVMTQGVTAADLTLQVTYLELSQEYALHVPLTPTQLTEHALPLEFSARQMGLHGRVVNVHTPDVPLSGVSLVLSGPPQVGTWCTTTTDLNGAYTCPDVVIQGDLDSGFVFTAALSGMWGTRQVVHTIPTTSLPPLGRRAATAFDLQIQLTSLSLSGRVVDIAGQGLSGATVEIAGSGVSAAATTGASGEYSASLVFTRTVVDLDIRVEQGVFTQTRSEHITLTANALTTYDVADIVFSSRRMRLAGDVLNANLSGHPLANTSVRLSAAGHGVWCQTISTAEGHYQCPPLQIEGDYADFIFTGTLSGTWGSDTRVYTVPVAVQPTAGQETEVTFDLQAGPTTLHVTGRVVDTTEQGLEGATVSIADSEPPLITTSDPLGQYDFYITLSDTTSLSLTLHVTYGILMQMYHLQVPISSSALQTYTRDLEFSARRLLFGGRLINSFAPDMAVKGADVRLSTPAHGAWCSDVTDEYDGTYVCPGLVITGDVSSGLEVSVTSWGVWGSLTTSHTLGAGDMPGLGQEDIYGVNQTISPLTLHLVGSVQASAYGYPLAGAFVRATGDVEDESWTDGDGMYSLYAIFTNTQSTVNLDLEVTCSAMEPSSRPLTLPLQLDRLNVYTESFALSITSINEDIDEDGYVDLVVSNYRDDSSTNTDSFIYWGGSGGYVTTSRTALPTTGAYGNAVADLNNDGHLDVVFANNQSDGNSLVYWGDGSRDGLTLTQRSELPTQGATGVGVADLNEDDYLDLVFANNYGDSIIYWGSADGYSPDWYRYLPTSRARAVEVADLDGDGWLEVIFANESGAAYVYWGSDEGYSYQAHWELEDAQYAYDVLASDLDGDGDLDLAFATHYEYGWPSSNYNVNSTVYWGDGTREGWVDAPHTDLPTHGAYSLAAADFDRDGHVDLAFANHTDGSSYDVDSYVYWGGTDRFTSTRRLALPTNRATGVVAADLYRDGRPELVFGQEYDDGVGSYAVPNRVYLNGSAGLTTTNVISLPGWGTIGIGAVRPPVTGTHHSFGQVLAPLSQPRALFQARAGVARRGEAPLEIPFDNLSALPGLIRAYHWSFGDGEFSSEISPTHIYEEVGHYTVTLVITTMDGTVGVATKPAYVAVSPPPGGDELDLDGDHYTDLVVSNYCDDGSTSPDSFIYWGGPGGYVTTSRTALPTMGAYGNAAADLNNDGHLDVVFANTNGDSVIYWGDGQREGFTPTHRSDLPTGYASGVAVADLNADDYLDLVFAGDGGIIYWGSASGYSTEWYHRLPTGYAYAVDVADLDDDGWLDLVFATSYSGDIYWGSELGYSSLARTELGASNAYDVAVLDLDNDGHLDVVLAENHEYSGPESVSYDIYSTVYWGDGTREGLSDANHTVLPTQGAHAVAAADFDRDGHVDLAFANNYDGGHYDLDSYVYWGGAGDDYYTVTRRLALPTNRATGVVAADLDRDGWPELVFGQERDELLNSYAVPNRVYWNSPAGFNPGNTSRLPGWGTRGIGAVRPPVTDTHHSFGQVLAAWGVPKADFGLQAGSQRRGTSPLDVAFADLSSSASPITSHAWDFGDGDVSSEASPTHSYANVGHYTVTLAITTADGRSDQTVKPAYVAVSPLPDGDELDLDGDHYTDLVVSNYRDDGSTSTDSFIYWGGPSGYVTTSRTALPTIGAYGNAVADLDNDGHLDVVFANNQSSSSVIYWGDGEREGFTPTQRSELPTWYATGVAVADLDKNDYLDLVFATTSSGGGIIYWGSTDVYSSEQCHYLPTVYALAVDVADLDGDSYLDLVFADYDRVYVYWGGLESYSVLTLTELGASQAHDVAVLDLDGDTDMDVVVANYTNGFSGDSMVYWGDGTREGWVDAPHTDLPTQGAYAVAAADFDRDGHVDLAFANHYDGGSYTINSYVYWGGAGDDYYTVTRRLALPTVRATGVVAADLDRDGWPELVFGQEHDDLLDGYAVPNRVYWNSPAGFNPANTSSLPGWGTIGIGAVRPPVTDTHHSFGQVLTP